MDIAVLSYSRFFKMGKKWVNLKLHMRKPLILRRLFIERLHCRDFIFNFHIGIHKNSKPFNYYVAQRLNLT